MIRLSTTFTTNKEEENVSFYTKLQDETKTIINSIANATLTY